MAYTIESFLKMIRPMAKKDMEETGVFASLTIAQAILESRYGNSGLTMSANNLFGIKGDYNGSSVTMPTYEYENGMRTTIQAKFRQYPSWQESIKDHSDFLTKYNRYKPVLAAKDYKEACYAIQAAGYATDPNYAKQLISLIEQYKLYEEDDIVNIIKVKIELNGTEKEVEAINVNGTNYIKLRDLADGKINVDYDAAKKVPVVKSK